MVTTWIPPFGKAATPGANGVPRLVTREEAITRLKADDRR